MYIYMYIYTYMYDVCVCVCVYVCIFFVCIGIGHLDDADEDNGRPHCTPVYDYDHTGASF